MSAHSTLLADVLSGGWRSGELCRESVDMPHTHTLPIVDRILSWSLRHPLSASARFVATTLLIVAVGLFRAFVVTAVVPWLLFIPAVLLISLMLGQAAGIYSGLLAAVVAGVSIGHVREPFWLTEAQWIGSVLFVLVMSGIAAVAAELRAAFARADRLMAEKEDALALLGEREAFLSSVLASSTDCIKVLDLDARLRFMTEGGQKAMEVSDFNSIAGCPWPDFWQDKENAEAIAAVAAAKAGKSRNFIGKTPTFAGTMKWWDVAVSPVLGPDGLPTSILSVSRDITATRESEEERSQLARMVENSADFIGMARLDGSVFFVNDAGLRLVGLDRSDLKTVRMADFFSAEEAEAVWNDVLPAVERDGSWSGERLFRHFGTGELIPVIYTVFPVSDHDGELIGYGTVTRDNRERKRAEEQQELLNGELSHRLKNVLAVVQSVAGQTLRQADDLSSANDALSARLTALAQATDVLTAQSWTAANLSDVVERTLAPHGVRDRLRVSGPEIVLHPQVTMAFALALHELATNACKYGALSNESGSVELTWDVSEGPIDGAPRFQLRWQESGGPEVRLPSRKGFGTKMIERSLRAYFRGPAELDYRPDGLVFTLDAPLGDAGRVRE